MDLAFLDDYESDKSVVGKFLVRAGAKIGDTESYGNCHQAFLQSILDLNQQLRDAAEEGDLEAVTRLVRDEGAQVNGADDEVRLC